MEEYRVDRITDTYDEPVDFFVSSEQVRQSALASVGTGVAALGGVIAVESFAEAFVDDSSCSVCIEQASTPRGETGDEIMLGLAASSVAIAGASFVVLASALAFAKNVQRWAAVKQQRSTEEL